jgi:ribosomal-protein-alanine N-acetyltransferase
MTPTLETQRLILRPLGLSDAAQTQVLFPQWEIVRYLRNVVPWPYPTDGAYMYYRDVALPAVERGDEWAWTLRLKSATDQLIGAISLFRSETDNRGFWLGLPWQRQGLITEACHAVTDYWFNVLRFPVLRVPKAIANTGSRRISEKQGMRVIATEDRDYVSGRFPSEIWEITVDEWRARQQSQFSGR